MEGESALGMYQSRRMTRVNDAICMICMLEIPRRADLSTVPSLSPSHTQTHRDIDTQLWEVMTILLALLLFNIINILTLDFIIFMIIHIHMKREGDLNM